MKDRSDLALLIRLNSAEYETVQPSRVKTSTFEERVIKGNSTSSCVRLSSGHRWQSGENC